MTTVCRLGVAARFTPSARPASPAAENLTKRGDELSRGLNRFLFKF